MARSYFHNIKTYTWNIVHVYLSMNCTRGIWFMRRGYLVLRSGRLCSSCLGEFQGPCKRRDNVTTEAILVQLSGENDIVLIGMRDCNCGLRADRVWSPNWNFIHQFPKLTTSFTLTYVKIYFCKTFQGDGWNHQVFSVATIELKAEGIIIFYTQFRRKNTLFCLILSETSAKSTQIQGKYQASKWTPAKVKSRSN